jgi:hypothetical protein
MDDLSSCKEKTNYLMLDALKFREITRTTSHFIDAEHPSYCRFQEPDSDLSNIFSPDKVSQFFFARRWQLVQCDVVGSGIARFNLGFRASRILCLDVDSPRTGALGNEVDVIKVQVFLIYFASLAASVVVKHF